MVDKIEINTERGIKVDDVAVYLAYLSFDGVEPVVSDEVKEFGDDLMQKFDVVDGLGYKGARKLDGSGNFFSQRDNDAETEYAFDDSREAIYLVLTDIVKRDFDGCWLKLLFALLDNASNTAARIKIKTQYRNINYDRSVISLKDLQDLVDGDITDDAQFILDLKAEILAQISRSINNAYFSKYSVPFRV